MWEASHLNDEERVGQLLWVGISGHTLTPDTTAFLRAVRPGGIILFQRNVASRDQLQRLCRRLSGLLPIPPFLAIDQEGGRVNRLQPILAALPTGADLSDTRDRRLVERYARAMGDCLRQLGLQVNFAPVLDLSGRDDTNGIGDRAFGPDPDQVAEFGEAFLVGLKRAQILGAMKHFPGLGAAAVDSHLSLPEIRKGRRKLWEEDLEPFRQLAPLAPITMVAHAWYPSLSGQEPTPASLSRRIVEEILLGEMNYRGLVVSDDLEMGAIEAAMGIGTAAVRAIEAGNDMILICRSRRLVRTAARALQAAAQSGSLPTDRFDRSLQKILALKRRFLQARRDHGTAQHFRRAAADLGRLRERVESHGAGATPRRRRSQSARGASRPVSRRKISR